MYVLARFSRIAIDEVFDQQGNVECPLFVLEEEESQWGKHAGGNTNRHGKTPYAQKTGPGHCPEQEPCRV